MELFRGVKLGLIVTIGMFAAITIYTSLTIVERQNQLREVSRYNIVWASSQALAEFHRLEHRVAAFALGHGDIDKDEVQTRFDILHNRLNILKGGDVGALTEHFADLKPVIAELEMALKELDPIVQAIDKPGNPQKVLDRLQPLEKMLIRFAGSANQFGGSQVAEDQQSLLTLHWLFSGAAGGLFLCGLVFIILLFYQNRVIHKAHEDLHALALDLKRAKDAAVAGNEAKSRFLANMSHELRTPLNAIIGFSELITSEAFGPIGQTKYRDYAVDILKSGRHMYDLVNDILTMAKLDAGHFEMTFEPMELQSVVESTIGIFKGTEMAQERDVAIAEQSEFPVLEGDERAVRQMLLNLLSNAVKFSEADRPVRIACRRSAGGEVELSIADRGIGMSEPQARLAVQPFQQIDSSMSRRYEGTGLGLSIVKALVERHGGRLLIDSMPGEGTTITLVFPAGLVRPPSLLQAA